MAITGTGTSSDPYIVHNLTELQTVGTGRGTYWTAGQQFYTKLVEDIDATGIDWPYMSSGAYSPRMDLDLDGHSILNIGWTTDRYDTAVFTGNYLRNGTITVNATNVYGSVFGFSGYDILFLDNLNITCEISFKQQYRGYWSYNSNYMFTNCSLFSCIVDATIHYADQRGYVQGGGNRSSIFWYNYARSSEKYITLSDIKVTCLGACNYYNANAVDSIITNATTENVNIIKSRITGTVVGEDMTYNQFISNDKVILDTCVLELDFSECQMPSTFGNGTLISTTAVDTVIDTDTLSVFDGRISAGTGMIPCTYTEIRKYSDLTSKQFPVTRTGETPPAGWSWLITDGYLPYLENFDPPPAPEPGADKAVYRYYNDTGWVKEGSIYVRADGAWVAGSSGPPPIVLDAWEVKTWSGLTSFYGTNVWTDGTDIYYSANSSQYVLNKSNSTWTAKTWTGVTSISGKRVWKEGSNIYCSDGRNAQYVLAKNTSTWTAKTWSGFDSAYGEHIWTDGTNIYYSRNDIHYVLDVGSDTWLLKTWNGLTIFSGDYIWTDGDDIYCSDGSDQYVLNTATSTWVPKTWNGLATFDGTWIWTDGTDIYCSNGSSTQYVLNKATSTWSQKTWSGTSNIQGANIWTDSTTYYCSNYSQQYYATGHVVPGPTTALKIHERVNNAWQDK